MSVIGQMELGVRITFPALHCWTTFCYWLAGFFYYNQFISKLRAGSPYYQETIKRAV